MAQVCPAPETGRWIRTLLIAAATLAACGAPVAVRAAQTLGLADAERVAIQRDAVLAQLAAESAGMRQRAIAEGSLMDPRLRVGAVNVPVNDWSLTAEDMTMVEVGVSQEFPSGRTRSLARQRMEQISTASLAAAQDRRRAVQREVRRVWVELAWIGAARELVDGQVQWVEQMRNAARARYASGEGRQIDLLQAGLDVAMLREQRLDLDREEAMQRAQLARWLGEEDAARAGPFILPARAELPPLATLQAGLETHPAQQDYERRIEAAQTGVALAEQATRPGWMLDLSYGFRGGEMDGKPRPDMVTAMVSVDLPFFRSGRTSAEIDAARAEAEGLHEMHTDHQREMRAMLAEAWTVVQRTGEIEQYYETDLVPLAEQTVKAAMLAYRSNRAMFDDVVEARRVALETGMKRLRMAADRAQAQYQIDYLAGESP
jgi:outer membrane protein TolC